MLFIYSPWNLIIAPSHLHDHKIKVCHATPKTLSAQGSLGSIVSGDVTEEPNTHSPSMSQASRGQGNKIELTPRQSGGRTITSAGCIDGDIPPLRIE